MGGLEIEDRGEKFSEVSVTRRALSHYAAVLRGIFTDLQIAAGGEMLEKDIRIAAKLRDEIAVGLFVETWEKVLLDHKELVHAALVRYYSDLNNGMLRLQDVYNLAILLDYTKHEMFIIKVIADKNRVQLPEV